MNIRATQVHWAEEPWGLYEIVLSKQIKDQQTLMQEGAEITAPITT